LEADFGRPPLFANCCREQVQQHAHATDYLLDHLVGGGDERRRHGEAKHPGGLVIDDQLERTKRAVPPEFTRVASNLDASCGEEDFRKAWISIDWMNGCLNNFTKDAELGFCSRNEGYSCALDPRSDACPQGR
jgi:hypothetical protein